jgi:hypothetical protein
MRTHRASLIRAMGWNAYTSIEVSHPRAIVPGYDYDREPSAVYVLWGSKLDHAGEQWVKLETFTTEAKERREREGWSTRELVKGTRP